MAAGLGATNLPKVAPLVKSTLGSERRARQQDYADRTSLEKLLAGLFSQRPQQGIGDGFTAGGQDRNGIAPMGRGTWGEHDLTWDETVDAMARLGDSDFWGSTPYGAILGAIGNWFSPAPTKSPVPVSRPAGLGGGADYSGFGDMASRGLGGISVDNFGYGPGDAMSAPSGGWGGGGGDRDGGGFADDRDRGGVGVGSGGLY